MKRAPTVSKTKSSAAGPKRTPRRRLAVVRKSPAPAKRKAIAKSKPGAKRKSVTKRPLVTKSTTPTKSMSLARRKTVTKSKPTPPRKAKPKRIPRPAAKTKASVRRTSTKRVPVRRPRLKIPDYLLEGDVPTAPAVTGPGEKFALGPKTPGAHFAAEPAHLPETYGTGRLYVTPRDPHWLYAHWDIAPREQFQHNARSVDRHLILRVHETEVRVQPVAEIHVHPESRHWFAHVERADTVYVTELGYYQTGRRWKSLATSAPTKTPADHISADATVEFATIPLELSFETMLALLQEGTEEKLPLAQAIDQLRVTREATLPSPPEISAWTPEQEAALAAILAADRAGLALPSSQDLVGEAGVHGADLSAIPPPSSYGSSFFGGAGGNAFWFQANAELLIYGVTRPDAKVTLAGKQIALRPDGSFSFRFSFPDGHYALPIVAIAADDSDGRVAELKFTRATEFIGDVGEPPQNPALNPPPQNG